MVWLEGEILCMSPILNHFISNYCSVIGCEDVFRLNAAQGCCATACKVNAERVDTNRIYSSFNLSEKFTLAPEFYDTRFNTDKRGKRRDTGAK